MINLFVAQGLLEVARDRLRVNGHAFDVGDGREVFAPFRAP
jgi:hypothetical protein